MSTMIDDDRLNETFAALANTTRRAILARLANGQANVNELAAPFELTLPAISKHIKVLEHAGLIVRGHRAQFRPCTLDTIPLQQVASWAERYRPIWDARFDRMDDLHHATRSTNERTTPVSDTSDPPNSVIIERIIDAPADVVWRMWTQPEHFAAWYGPNGATIPTAELDVRAGGLRRVCMQMHTPNGIMPMWFTGAHLEVTSGRRLTYTEAMTDEDGNVLAAADLGMPDGHPTTTEVRIELDDVGGRTNMRLTHVGVPADSPGAAGWTMAFDKLAAYIQTQD